MKILFMNGVTYAWDRMIAEIPSEYTENEDLGLWNGPFANSTAGCIVLDPPVRTPMVVIIVKQRNILATALIVVHESLHLLANLFGAGQYPIGKMNAHVLIDKYVHFRKPITFLNNLWRLQ